MKKRPIVLCILDGYGLTSRVDGNAVKLANTPNLDDLMAMYPTTTIQASGNAVGLPEGQMGNSEVGHMNIGAGRVVYQSLTLINKAVEDGEFYENEEFLAAIKHAKDHGSKLHIWGLLSSGGVHSFNEHIYALLTLARRERLEKVYVHAFLDGRDVAPDSGLSFVEELDAKMKEIGVGEIASISGRYYAMDRDKRFDRVDLAYKAIAEHEGPSFTDPVQFVKDSYANEVYDEFVVPGYNSNVDGAVENDDAVIFANFRPDRAIQMATVITNPEFYADKGYVPAVKRENDKEIEGAKRDLINSPKVATYDLQPEMSAYEVKDKLIEELDSGEFDVVIVNFANCDMVGHTGIIPAAISAVETVDECVGEVYDKVLELGGTMLITADHGNAETLLDEEGNPFTAHTTNVVPLIVTNSHIALKEGGKLGDLAPTILTLLGLEVPEEMTGNVLIDNEPDCFQ